MNAVRQSVLLACALTLGLASGGCRERPDAKAASRPLTAPTAPVKATGSAAQAPTAAAVQVPTGSAVQGPTGSAVEAATGSAAQIAAATPTGTEGPARPLEKLVLKKTETVPEGVADPKNVVDVALNQGLKKFWSYVNTAELTRALGAEGPLTVFAPSDEAFAAVPADTMAALRRDRARLKVLLLDHVVAGKVAAADLAKAGKLKTMGGAEIPVKTDGGAVLFGDAKVTKADVAAPNGIIHIVDKVFIPAEEAKPAEPAPEKPAQPAAAKPEEKPTEPRP